MGVNYIRRNIDQLSISRGLLHITHGVWQGLIMSFLALSIYLLSWRPIWEEQHIWYIYDVLLMPLNWITFLPWLCVPIIHIIHLLIFITELSIQFTRIETTIQIIIILKEIMYFHTPHCLGAAVTRGLKIDHAIKHISFKFAFPHNSPYKLQDAYLIQRWDLKAFRFKNSIVFLNPPLILSRHGVQWRSELHCYK